VDSAVVDSAVVDTIVPREHGAAHRCGRLLLAQTCARIGAVIATVSLWWGGGQDTRLGEHGCLTGRADCC
jgi:hypothetical protein